MSAYGPDGPSSNLPGTDAVGQAIGGVTEAFAVPASKEEQESLQLQTKLVD